MEFISTRNQSIRVSAAEAILRGIAPDGGLFVPDSMPAFSAGEIAAMGQMEYPALAAEVLSRFLPGFTKEELSEYTKKAYASFDTPAVAPMARLDRGEWVLELFHGPTCAFKDFALQMLPYLMAASAKKCGDTRTIAILVATSGDTGKAALAGFADVPGTKIGVFYPDGGVSDIQRLQMVTQSGENVFVSAVNGNFDDAQSGVKAIFTDKAVAERLEKAGVVLSSANSINWGRLAPQIAYYYAAYARLAASGAVQSGERVDFVVPTGNFGDILAGYFAKKSGLPVGKLVCASNSNDVLTDFFATGVYDRNRNFRLTMSPSMDILISSNLERLLYLASGDDAFVSAKMAELKSTGRYDIGAALLETLHEEGFVGYCADEEETARVIRQTWESRGYAADPHTAVALSAAARHRETSGGAPCVVLSTASPFKFSGAMLSSLGKERLPNGFDELRALEETLHTASPAPLSELEKKTVRFPGVVKKESMASAVLDWLGK